MIMQVKNSLYRKYFYKKIFLVQCLSDGIRLYLDRENSSQKPFHGVVFVKGLNGNPYCSKNFNGSESVDYAHKNSVFFHIPIAHCDMDLETNVSSFHIKYFYR